MKYVNQEQVKKSWIGCGQNIVKFVDQLRDKIAKFVDLSQDKTINFASVAKIKREIHSKFSENVQQGMGKDLEILFQR